MSMLLVRHLPTDLPPGLCYGRLDPPPGAAADPAALLETLQVWRGLPIWSSPSRRCQDLAAFLAGALDARLRLEPRLQELDFGAWEGRPWDEVPREALDAWATDPWGFAPPGGESGAALVARMRQLLHDLPPAAILVSHGGPLKVLAALLRGEAVDLLSPAQPMGSVLLCPAPGAGRGTDCY